MRSGILLVCILLSACSSQMEFKSPAVAPNVKDEVELATLQKQSEADPKNLVLRAYIVRQKEFLANKFLNEAAIALQHNDFDGASDALDKVLAINPNLPSAKEGKIAIEAGKRHLEWLEQAKDAIEKNNTEQAEAKLKAILIESPRYPEAKQLLRQINLKKDSTMPAALKANISKPITLEFKETSLKTIFEMISRSSNINFIFDKEVKGDTKATVFVRNTKIEEAIQVILLTNQLAKKILSDNTILIYPNTVAKNKEYQELIVRNFYLANADIKQTMNVIKTIVKTTDIVYDEKLNMLTMRDTPEAIHLAEKLIAAQDMAEPEVMLELEVLEVSRSRLQNLGVRFPESLSISALNSSGGAGALTLKEWSTLNSSSIRATITDPSLILNLQQLDTDANLLANPRIRVRNREKAKVHIGERVPVITTTSTANVGISESVNYLDVGLKLDIEPNVYLDDEVAMKVGLEVSSILETITRSSGTQTYRLGTRNTATTLRLKDGETQVLAGLIQDNESKTINNIPGISELPLIGKLFSNRNTNKTKTEIVLLITPRIIRNINQPEIDVAEFTAGTADAIGVTPIKINPQEIKSGQGASDAFFSNGAAPLVIPSTNLAQPGVIDIQIQSPRIISPNTMPVPLPPPPGNSIPVSPQANPPPTSGTSDIQVPSPDPVATPTEINASP